MDLYHKKVYEHLAFAIPLITFFAMFFGLLADFFRIHLGLIWLHESGTVNQIILSTIFAAGIYMFIRLIYWFIDRFKDSSN